MSQHRAAAAPDFHLDPWMEAASGPNGVRAALIAMEGEPKHRMPDSPIRALSHIAHTEGTPFYGQPAGVAL